MIFKEEIENTVSTLQEKKDNAELIFAVVTDSHLDDFEEDTLLNIKMVDQQMPFDFIIHLGDFLNGNIPKEYTIKILKNEMNKYREATSGGVFYPVQGNHDGYCAINMNCTASDMILDEEWFAATEFTKEYQNLKREACNPYFYVDFPEKMIRLIVLCPFSYEWTEEGKYKKLYQTEEVQIDWFKREALALDVKWTVILFSHDGPLNYYDQQRYEEEPWDGNKSELLGVLLEARKQRGFSIAAWFVGHWHGEVCQIVEGIPFVIVGSQTCYVPQLWSMPASGYYEKRKRGTVTQDLWDAVILNKSKREVYLCRFGAGKDRVIRY